MDPFLLLAAALALVGLLAVGTGLARGGLADLGDALRASLAEAGERTADRAVEFWEWLRLGR